MKKVVVTLCGKSAVTSGRALGVRLGRGFWKLLGAGGALFAFFGWHLFFFFNNLIKV